MARIKRIVIPNTPPPVTKRGVLSEHLFQENLLSPITLKNRLF